MFEPTCVWAGIASYVTIVELNIRKSLSGLDSARRVIISITDSLIFAGPTSDARRWDASGAFEATAAVVLRLSTGRASEWVQYPLYCPRRRPTEG